MDDYIDYFAKNKIGVLVNLNSPEDIGQKKYDHTVDNIREMRKKGVQVSVGINFYKGDLDLKFVLDVIEEFCFDTLRVGITAPNTKEKIGAGALAYYEDILDPIINLMVECKKRDCGVHFDCQKIPQCVLEKRAKQLEEIERDIYLDIHDEAGCTPVIDILPNLKAVRCFGISDKSTAVPIEKFGCEEDIVRYFGCSIDAIGILTPAMPRCTDCYSRSIGVCQGGCISYKFDDIKKVINVEYREHNGSTGA
jgi:hypothetical protein